MRRVRAAYDSAARALHRASSDEEATTAIRDMEMPLERARGRLSPERLASSCRSRSARVRQAAAHVLRFFKAPDVEAPLCALLGDEDPAVRGEAVESLVRVLGVERTARRLDHAAAETLAGFLDVLRYEPDVAAIRSILARFAEHPSPAVQESAAKALAAMDTKRR
jgi:HEAT repeat protein